MRSAQTSKKILIDLRKGLHLYTLIFKYIAVGSHYLNGEKGCLRYAIGENKLLLSL